MLYFDAVYNILTKDPEYFERAIRRWACKELNMSYLDTFKMEWPTLLTLYYETILSEKKKNELIAIAKEEYLDKLIEKQERENERFYRQVMEEEFKKKQAVTGKKEKKQSSKKETKNPEIKEFDLKFDDIE